MSDNLFTMLSAFRQGSGATPFENYCTTGLAYFLNEGSDPVYEKKIAVERGVVRVTAHRITDALVMAGVVYGAITLLIVLAVRLIERRFGPASRH